MKLPFETDDGKSAIAALGIIVLQSDETLEAEFRTIFNLEGVALFHTRIPMMPNVTPSTLQQMELELPQAAGLLPTARPLDVVGYGCTSGATVIGADNVAAAIHTKHPGAKNYRSDYCPPGSMQAIGCAPNRAGNSLYCDGFRSHESAAGGKSNQCC